MERIKILVVVPNLDQGGAQKALVEIFNQIAVDSKYEITILSCYASDFYIPDLNGITYINGKNKYSRKFKGFVYLEAFKFSINIKHILKKMQPQYIIAGWEGFSEIAIFFAFHMPFIRQNKNKLKKITIIQTSLSGIYKELGVMSKLLFNLEALIRKLFYDKIILVNPIFNNDPLLKNTHKTQVIANPVNIKGITEKSNLNTEIFQIKTPYILNLARINIQKNQALLIQAYAKSQIRKTHKLVIMGEHYDKILFKKLKDLSIQLEVNSDVLFIGPQKNPYPILRNAFFLAISSNHEGWPLVALEAMALRIPVLTTEFSGYDFLFTDSNSVHVPVNDIEAYSEALNWLSDSVNHANLVNGAYNTITAYEANNIATIYKSQLV